MLSLVNIRSLRFYNQILILNLEQSLQMIDEPKSLERQYYRQTLFQKLKKTRQALATTNLYLQERAAAIVWSFFSNAQLFGTGLVAVFTKETLKPDQEIGKAVVVAILDDAGQAEIENNLHYFSDIFIINLTVSSREATQGMKVSPIRKKLRGFFEISLNFIPFVDTIYSVNQTKTARQVGFVQGLTSYLISLPKFHEFQINFSKTNKNTSLATTINQSLNNKLGVLLRHQCSQYKESSSPRIKVLLIDRKIDMMSPLVYSYYYGPISKQLQLLEKYPEFGVKSLLFSSLYSMDIQEASDFLVKLANDKAGMKKQTLEKSNVQQIKKAITVFCDNTASTKQIQININSLTTVKDFCKRRAVATALQQTIINNRSQSDEKMSPSKIINRIIEWSNLPQQEYKASEEDYIKILILTYMVNSFWFFQRKIINAGLEESRKAEIVSFCKKVENTCQPLKEKPQGAERYDLYRHQPAIVSEIDDWISNKRQFQSVAINKSSANRESRYIVAVDGPLGYNEACFIQRYLKERQQKIDITIFCQRLVTTKEYMSLLLKGNGGHN